MKKILYIDMDGVIVDYHSAKPSQEDIKKYGSDDNVPGLYKKMKSMPNAIEAVQKLSEYYDVYILSTAPWDNTSAWSDKLDWVKKYLPFMKKRLILSHNKQLNIGDYLIDDRPHKNGAGEFGETCYGKLLHFGKDGEYKDWQAVLDYLLKEENNKEKESQSFDDEVYKIWNILPPIMQLDYTASDVDKVVHHISNLIDINHIKYHDAKLEFDKIFDYVEDQLFVCYGNFETEFVEEVIRMYNQVNKFYEEEEE